MIIDLDNGVNMNDEQDHHKELKERTVSCSLVSRADMKIHHSVLHDRERQHTSLVLRRKGNSSSLRLASYLFRCRHSKEK